MKLLTIFLITFSITGCTSVERPDTNLYIYNHKGGYLRGYNMKTDYNKKGVRNKDAKPKIVYVKDLSELNKFLMTDPTGAGNLKLYIQDLIKALDAYQ